MSDLARQESYQYPATHIGHLTESQQTQLEKFKGIAKESGYYQPASTEGAHASHDDETMLRYLRARKFVPNEALKQFKDTEDWRKKSHIDELYDNIDLDEYDLARRLYPQWTGRRDKRGIPVYTFAVANLTSKAVSSYENSKSKHPTAAHSASTVPSKMVTLFALYENLTKLVLPLCSAVKGRPHSETPISQSSNIVDISGVGLKQFWNLKGHMQDASQLATAYYPETLDRIFIIGAPSFFPTVWGWIKRWFDPITVSKIFILSPNDVKPTLEKYMDIEDIPRKYGGNLQWDFGDLPLLEPAILETLKWKGADKTQLDQFKGPIRFQENSEGKMDAVAVGSIDGKARKQTIAKTDASFNDLYGPDGSHKGSKRPPNATLERLESTTGTHTHPEQPSDSELYYGSSLKSGTATPQPQSSNDSSAAVDQTLSPANATHNQPAIADPSPETLPPSASQPRAGTSETRMAGQSGTHAAGQLAEGTPHLVDHNQSKVAVVEPDTVGQAPKDVYANVPSPQHEAPSYMDQAKGVASAAYESTANAGAAVASSVLAIVGGKGQEEETVKPEPQVNKAPAEVERKVDSAKDENVEAFLRSQTVSPAAGGSSNGASQ